MLKIIAQRTTLVDRVNEIVNRSVVLSIMIGASPREPSFYLTSSDQNFSDICYQQSDSSDNIFFSSVILRCAFFHV